MFAPQVYLVIAVEDGLVPIAAFGDKQQAEEACQLLWYAARSGDPGLDICPFEVQELSFNSDLSLLRAGQRVFVCDVSYNMDYEHVYASDTCAILESDWYITSTNVLRGKVWAKNAHEALDYARKVRAFLITQGIWTPQIERPLFLVSRFVYPSQTSD